MVNMVVSSVGCRIGRAARFLQLDFIVRASASGAGNPTKHRHNAHQRASGKWYRCSADSPAISWPSIYRPE
jgi:hypothetical protein